MSLTVRSNLAVIPVNYIIFGNTETDQDSQWFIVSDTSLFYPIKKMEYIEITGTNPQDPYQAIRIQEIFDMYQAGLA